MAFEDEFQDGDLIYGLNSGRVGYIQRLGVGRYGNVLIVDDLNNQFLGTGVGPGMARVGALGTGGTGTTYNRSAILADDAHPEAVNFMVFMETHRTRAPSTDQKRDWNIQRRCRIAPFILFSTTSAWTWWCTNRVLRTRHMNTRSGRPSSGATMFRRWKK
jgi:hypothetical protein